jgi:hypothetical protein
MWFTDSNLVHLGNELLELTCPVWCFLQAVLLYSFLLDDALIVESAERRTVG